MPEKPSFLKKTPKTHTRQEAFGGVKLEWKILTKISILRFKFLLP